MSVGAVVKLQADIGKICPYIEHKKLRRLNSYSIQCDEVWGFVHIKPYTIKRRKQQNRKWRPKKGQGVVWLWVAIDAFSKLVIAWHLGKRGYDDAYKFMEKVKARVRNKRLRIATDKYVAYGEVIADVFPRETVNEQDKAGTSYIERHHLTLRSLTKRYARKTNAYSKKRKQHRYALALYFVWYNFCRPHHSLGGITPAMSMGLAETVWSARDLVKVLENPKALPA